ncbi:MAG TPA: tRNA (N6-threonylcarbamoyladenosine(37)-N6)-methyltransferase TrmO [Dehalococcoidales bacterium]|nr:tRNA (N6-threonylcarbamoyladenosine(37)-N6)-methyltransferase TrmO [Dehalococcoidales bacterium]
MADKLPEMTLIPIGFVRNGVKEPVKRRFRDVVSEIVIDSGLTEALDDIEEFSHLIVIFWLHRSRRPAPKKVYPMGNPEHGLMGVFATRSPDRPNPLGKTTVELLERQGNVLKVRGLDAIDGTPVIDIKPYIPGYDSAADARAPSWMVKE